jgi:hypothetical protein
MARYLQNDRLACKVKGCWFGLHLRCGRSHLEVRRGRGGKQKIPTQSDGMGGLPRRWF